MNQDEMTLGLWSQRKKLCRADDEIKGFRTVGPQRADRLRQARKAMLYSLEQAADLLGVTRQVFLRLEQREASGKITLERLSAAAEAMGCELVYTIRPRRGKSFAEATWARIADEVEARADRQICIPQARYRLKVAIALRLLQHRKYLEQFRVNRRRRL